MHNKDLKKNNIHILIIDDDEKIRLLLKQFLENNDFKVLVRKTTVVKSSRNVYHNMMSLIPGITIDRSKSLYNHFDSFSDFINNIQNAKDVDEKKRWHTQVNKIEEFINKGWEDTPERKVIVDKNN